MEIICRSKDCMYNKENHCIKKSNFITLNEIGSCIDSEFDTYGKDVIDALENDHPESRKKIPKKKHCHKRGIKR